ncbi:hypothetical protein ACFFQF_26355 [Haladaptatus pallidirubidus]|uniref:hypothetical protein n=1 Tax=Haladaptatus pallidirubidus TaxID=1008152 RepID=UPI001D0FA374|nr:hypothetical protein [Haladaptatus pallidirubidus]
MPSDEQPWLQKRRPRIDPPSHRTEHERSKQYAQLQAELETLRQRLAETEARLKSLEMECERRERLVRSCSICGRVSTHRGPGALCPYCDHGTLHRV